jgi:hypothetical protein
VNQAPQLSDLGDLVGRVDDRREAAGAAGALTDVVLPVLLVLDRRVVADERYDLGDLGPEPGLEVRRSASVSSRTSWRTAAATMWSGSPTAPAARPPRSGER